MDECSNVYLTLEPTGGGGGVQVRQLKTSGIGCDQS